MQSLKPRLARSSTVNRRHVGDNERHDGYEERQRAEATVPRKNRLPEGRIQQTRTASWLARNKRRDEIVRFFAQPGAARLLVQR